MDGQHAILPVSQRKSKDPVMRDRMAKEAINTAQCYLKTSKAALFNKTGNLLQGRRFEQFDCL
jgi:hypothetical protein